MKKIQLWLAIIININIVIGGAFFAGAPKLAMIAGHFAPLAWIVCGAAMAPIVYALSQLAVKYPFAGGLYVYASRTFGRKVGLLSGWAYFLGGATANAALIHMFSGKILDFVSSLSYIKFSPTALFGLDALILFLFFVTVMRGVQVLEKMQIALSVLKSWPFILCFLGGTFLANYWPQAPAVSFYSNWFFESLHLVVFAYLGVEAICSIISKIEEPEKNSRTAIFGSFALIMMIYASAQFWLMRSLGQASASPFAFELLSNLFFKDNTSGAIGRMFMSFAIASSYFGGAYSFFYANNWNFYAMSYDMNGEENNSSFFTKFNEFGEPFGSICVQTALILLSLLIFNVDSMCAISDIGTLIAFFLSALAFKVSFFRWDKSGLKVALVAFLALASSFLLSYYIFQFLMVELSIFWIFIVLLSIFAPVLLLDRLMLKIGN